MHQKMKYPIKWYFSKRCIKDMLTCKSVTILLLKKKFNEVVLFIVIFFFISSFLILDQILNMIFVYNIILNYLLLQFDDDCIVLCFQIIIKPIH